MANTMGEGRGGEGEEGDGVRASGCYGLLAVVVTSMGGRGRWSGSSTATALKALSCCLALFIGG
jgi:hypothetical protein